MSRFSYLLLCSFLCLFTACGGDGAATEGEEGVNSYTEAQLAEQQEASTKMMVIHDEAMARMGEMTSYEKAVTQELASGELTPDRQSQLEAVLEKLTDANDDMMEWMPTMRPADDLLQSGEHDRVMKHYMEQIERANQVDMQINQSIEMAKTAMDATVEAQ